MNKIAVIDTGFGDSGKGHVTAFICHNYPNSIVYRFSGGHQAGHTVVHNRIRHVFSSFGSGTLQGKPTYWSENCTFYPIAFLNELDALHEKGITPKIYVNGNCPVTTPYDVYYNRKQEEDNKHGSCGVGFGATLEREEKYYSLLVKDLLFSSVRDLKIREIKRYYGDDIDIVLDGFIHDCEDVLNYINIVDDDITNNYEIVVYEGSQGLLLDKDIGFFPHVTRANVGTKGIKDKNNLDLVVYVTRAYQTRHGNGPMTNEHIRHNIKENPNETNVSNYQGEFRRSILDLDLIKYSIAKDNCNARKELIITCLDHVENNLLFTYNGKLIGSSNEEDFIDKISEILNIKNVYISKSDDYRNIRCYKNNKD